MSAKTLSLVSLLLMVALIGAGCTGPPDWYTPLMKAAYEDRTEEVLRLIKDRAPVNEPAPDATYPGQFPYIYSGTTALMAAARGNRIETAKILLEHGARVNAVAMYSATEATALIIAAQDGHIDLMKILLAHKADVNARSVWGQTALMRASENGHLEAVRLLVEHGADINAKFHGAHAAPTLPYPVTALNLVGAHKDVAAFLVQHGATASAPVSVPKEKKREGSRNIFAINSVNDIIAVALLAGLAIGLSILALLWALLNAAVLMWRARKLKGWTMPYRDASFVAFRASFVGLGVGCLASIPVIYAEESLTLLLGIAIPAFLASWWYRHSRDLLKLAGAPTPLALKDTGAISASVLAYQIPAALALWFLIDW